MDSRIERMEDRANSVPAVMALQKNDVLIKKFWIRSIKSWVVDLEPLHCFFVSASYHCEEIDNLLLYEIQPRKTYHVTWHNNVSGKGAKQE